jgi:phosphatidylglycerophosphate synthase
MKETIKEILQPIADVFSSMEIPEPIVHWGHPLMMAIVIFAMGRFAGMTGWRIRRSQEVDVVASNKGEHRKVAPLMFLFITLEPV